MKNIIILPTYNERENIGNIIPMIFKTSPDISILVVDDNSPDGTSVKVRELQSNFSNLKLLERKSKEGLGNAYINAFNEVLKDKEVETVIMMDADLSHDPKHLIEMLELRKKYDVVIGSRYVNEGKTEGWELHRRVLSRLGNMYAKFITGMPINECTGGFNAINADILRKIDFNKIDVSGYAFIMHLKYILYKLGATFIEIPICFKNRSDGVSKLSNMIVREGILAPWKMILNKIND